MSPKPGGPAMPTTEEVMGWDEDALFDWILQNEPRLVKDDRAEIFKKAAITGGIFVKYADNRDFFKECGLPMGVSDRLAELASELAGGEAVSIVQKRKEQDTSTKPSSKRRLLEESGAINPILVPLAENARNQRDYLQNQHPGREQLREQLSNPAIITKLPFPYPGKRRPTERFTILEDKFWSYMGREYFTTLREEVTQFLASSFMRLSLYGTIGYGKSHLLAALVCYLTLDPDAPRIVYIPDCRECCQDPLTYFQGAMLFTWADNITVQKKIMKLKSMEDVHDFFKAQQKILFIFDQINALDLEVEPCDTVPNKVKQEVRIWMDKFVAIHTGIYSASANYQARLRMNAKQTNFWKLYAFGGFSATEMQEWWKRNNDALPDEYKANDLGKDKPDDPDKNKPDDLDKDKPDDLNKDKPDDLDKDKPDDLDKDKLNDLKTFKSEVEDITGSIPLLLNSCIVDGKINLSAQKLNVVFSQVQEFMFSIYDQKGHQALWTRYCEYMTACIQSATPTLLPLRYIDHRYFYVENGVAKYACGIAREAAAKLLRERNVTAFASDISLKELVKFIRNPSITGFFIEQAVLSSIVTNGLAVKGVLPHAEQKMFNDAYPKFDTSTEDWVLYCPLRFNYPAVDAILVQFEKTPQNESGKKKCLMYPIQVTVAKSHADSEEQFFDHREEWSRGLEDYDIIVDFCWITPDRKLGQTEVSSSSRSLRLKEISRPSYKVTHIPLSVVSDEIWTRYERAKADTPRSHFG